MPLPIVGSSTVININSLQVILSNGNSAARAQMAAYAFNVATPGGVVATDGGAFIPTAAALATAVYLGNVTAGAMQGLPVNAAGSYGFQLSDLNVAHLTGSGGAFWVGLVLSANYTPIAGETVTVVMTASV